MQNKKQTRKDNFKIYLKSAVLTALAILLVIIGYIAAGYLFGVN